jgi:hypothetical protein
MSGSLALDLGRIGFHRPYFFSACCSPAALWNDAVGLGLTAAPDAMEPVFQHRKYLVPACRTAEVNANLRHG